MNIGKRKRDVTVEAGAGAGYGSGGTATVTATAGAESGQREDDLDPRLDFTALGSREETNAHLQRLRGEVVTVSVGPQEEDDRITINVRIDVGDTIRNDWDTGRGLGYVLGGSVVGPAPVEVLGPTKLLPMEIAPEWYGGGYVNSLGALAIDLTNGARVMIEPFDYDGHEEGGSVAPASQRLQAEGRSQ